MIHRPLRPRVPPRAHPIEPPPAFTRTTLPAGPDVAQVNGVYVVLQGVTPGAGAARVLMGGYGYLEWSTAGGAWHEGLDLNSLGAGDADLGATVVAPLDGIVTDVLRWDGRSQGFGNHLALWLDDPRASSQGYLHLAHLDTMRVTPGQRVRAGEPVATNGKSGRQPYAHCHTAIWHEVPPGGWDFWQAGYAKAWVARRTLDPQAWFWASATKAGGWVPPPETATMLEDWQVLHWVMPEIWQAAERPYNPDALTSSAWLAELRAGRYRGRPRSDDRPYGEGDLAGHWAEFEAGVCTTNAATGGWSWSG